MGATSEEATNAAFETLSVSHASQETSSEIMIISHAPRSDCPCCNVERRAAGIPRTHCADNTKTRELRRNVRFVASVLSKCSSTQTSSRPLVSSALGYGGSDLLRTKNSASFLRWTRQRTFGSTETAGGVHIAVLFAELDHSHVARNSNW